jgi:hypothetical protein
VRSNKKVYVFLGLAILVYAGLVFGTPTDPEALARYHMTTFEARLLSLTIVVPISLIWFFAFYGYVAFRDYARVIKKGVDGKAFSEISTGLAILAVGLPTSTIISSLVRIVTDANERLIPSMTVLNHYVNIAVTLFAFWYIHKGASRLQKITKQEPQGKEWSLLLGGFMALALTYVYLVLTNPARNTAEPTLNGQSIFYLPDWLIVTTIILPYLYIWYVGLVSGFYVNFYQKKVNGIIYKTSFRFLALGLIGVIGGSILRQYLTATSNLLADLRLAPLLVLIYTLLIAIAIGFVLIAIGARKLKHIEEV